MRRILAAIALLSFFSGGCIPAAHDERGFIPTPDGPEWVIYRVEGGRAIYQGDIVFDLAELRAFQAEHADDPHPLTVASYDLPNGQGLLDTTYDGSGAVDSALAPLTGGLGKLTDGRLPSDDNYSETVVQWSTIDPRITFRFRREVDLSAVRLYFRPVSSSSGSSRFPSRVELRMGGESFTYDPPAAASGASLLAVAGNFGSPLRMHGDSLEITLIRGSGTVLQLGEVELVTGNLLVATAAVSGSPWDQTVAYEIGSATIADANGVPQTVEFDTILRNEILTAIQDWDDASDFDFVEDPSAEPRIRFVPTASGCFTGGLGRPKVTRNIALEPFCGIGEIRHEIGHALGLQHEQVRPDRDEFIRYNEDYTTPAGRGQYEKAGRIFGEYNFHSLMHYKSSLFARTACCTLAGLDTTGGVLPRECDFLDEVGIDTNGDGTGDICPVLKPNRVPLQTFEPRFALPNGVFGTLSLSKGDLSAVNAMVAGADRTFADLSYNSLFFPAPRFTRPPKQYQVGDVNGDGRDDVVGFYMGNGSTGADGDVYVMLGQEDGSLAPPVKWHGWFCIDGEQCRLGDVDGDGDDDVLTFVPDGRVYVAVSDGHGFWNSTIWSGTFGSLLQYGADFAVADVDGDCREDVVAFRWVSTGSGTGYTEVRVGHSEPGSFVGATRWAQANGTRPALGDVNGDGRADLVAIGGNGDVQVYPSDGTRFGAAEVWAPGYCAGNVCPRIQIQPANGDAHGDLVVFDPDGLHHLLRTRVLFSTGWGFATAPRTYHELDCRGSHCTAGDVDGDGELDIVDPVAVSDPQDLGVGRTEGTVFVSLGTRIWRDPIGSVKPVLSLPRCPGSLQQ